MAKISAAERAATIQASGQWKTAKLTFIGVILVAIIGVAWKWLKPSPARQGTTVETTQGSNSRNLTIQNNSGTVNFSDPPAGAAPDEHDKSESPPPLPPSDFPDPSNFGIAPLTEAERTHPAYEKSILEIHNKTEVSVSVAIAFVPLTSSLPSSSIAKYIQRIIHDVLPGEAQERELQNFGGGAHFSVYSGGKWYPMNEWVNLGVVARRVLEIDKDDKGFVCRVQLMEPGK